MLITKSRLISFALLFIIIITVGCTRQEPTKASQKDINIGIVLPLTGRAASHGEDIMGGINLALDELNSSGGINGNKVKLIIEDNLSTPDGSVAALKKLLDINKVPVVIGPVASGNMLAMAPIAESNKTVLISPGASSPKLSEAGDYIFRNSLLATPQGKAIARYCKETLGLVNVAVLFIDDETGRGYKKAFVEEFKALGGNVLIVDSYDKRGSDFRAQLSKIKEVNPEAIYVPSIPSTFGLILRQAKELGIKTQFLANYGIEGEALLTAAGDAAEGIIYTSIPISEQFKKNFENKYGRKPTIGAPLGYDTFQVTAEAIRIGGDTSDGIKNALYSIRNFKGATGKVSFDSNGDAMKEIIIKTVSDDNFMEIKR